jgi:hypothetical protein
MLLVASALSFQAGTSSAATNSFAPVADTYTRSDTPSTNYGTSVRMSAQNQSGQVRSAYMRFNVSLPAGEVVTKATLKVYSEAAGTSTPVELHGVADTSWGEATLTWSNAPMINAAVAAQAAGYANNAYISFDATSLVSGSGLVSMALTNSGSTWEGFTSREGTNKPQLVVETVAVTTTTSSPPTTATSAPASGATATVSFSPVADTYSRSDTATTNYGTSPRVSAQNQSGQIRRAYLRFNVSVPAGSAVTKATLRMYSEAAGTSTPVELHGLADTTWGETALTWNNAPALNPAVVAQATGYANNAYVPFDATSLVSGSGLVSMALSTASSTWEGFTSREGTNKPQLIVETGGSGSTTTTTAPPPPTTTTTAPPTTTTTTAPPTTTTTTSPPPTSGDPVVAAAGDVACPGVCGQAETAKLITAMNPAAVLGLGDYQYDTGTLANFNSYYNPYWGQFKSKTYATNGGSHDFYGTGDYLTYFNNGGPVQLKPEGSFSFNVGTWHFVALDSYCFERSTCDEASVTSWLKADLAAHPNVCTAAYFHQPYWTSPSDHARSLQIKPWIQALYDGGVDVVLQAHNHFYERFAPQSPTDVVDTARGLTAFVVGTGGRSFYSRSGTAANSVAYNSGTYGVLKMTLHPSSADFKFVPIAGKTFTDSGTVNCH